MEKAVQIFENKKEFYLTSLAILVTGLLGLSLEVYIWMYNLIHSFRFVQQYKKEQDLNKPFAKDHSFFEKERLISKSKLLEILSILRKECAQDLRVLKEEFRKSRFCHLRLRILKKKEEELFSKMKMHIKKKLMPLTKNANNS